MTSHLLIALPKGRVQTQAIALLAKAGITISEEALSSRALIFEDSSGTYRFLTLKPVDIPVYVESGVIDAGIVGTDVLRESESDVNEPLDLQIGKCRMAVAGKEGAEVSYRQNLRVATKYPRTANAFFASRNAHVHIVRLEGSVEIAPLLGLADVIVDLVETGRTLRDNGMVVIEEIAKISSRLIVNRTAMKMKAPVVNELISQLDRTVYANT
jgi:ATP phosphoribosyltransferase